MAKMPAGLRGWATLSLCSLTTLGCAPSTLRTLQIRNVRDVRVLDIQDGRMSMQLSAEVEGHPRADVRLRDVTFGLAFRGAPFATGRIAGPLFVPARKAAAVSIPIELDFGRVTRQDLDALFEPSLPYRVTGTALVEIRGKARRLALDAAGALAGSSQGQLDVGPCDAPWGLVRFRGVGSDLATVLRGEGRVGLDVINPLRFPVDVSALDYRVAAGAKALGEGRLGRTLSLLPGTTSVDLPIDIDRVNVMATLASAWLGSAQNAPPPSFSVNGRLVLASGARTLALGFVCRS